MAAGRIRIIIYSILSKTAFLFWNRFLNLGKPLNFEHVRNRALFFIKEERTFSLRPAARCAILSVERGKAREAAYPEY